MAITETTTLVKLVALVICTPVAGAGPNDPTPFLIQNTDAANSVFLGGPDVTASGAKLGYQLTAGSALPFSLFSSDTLYAISAQAGGVNVVVLAGRQ